LKILVYLLNLMLLSREILFVINKELVQKETCFKIIIAIDYLDHRERLSFDLKYEAVQ